MKTVLKNLGCMFVAIAAGIALFLIMLNFIHPLSQADGEAFVVPSEGYRLLARDPRGKMECNTDSSPMWRDKAYDIDIPGGASKYITVKIPTHIHTHGREYHRYRWALIVYVQAEGENIVLEGGRELNKFWHEYDLCPNYVLEETQNVEIFINLPVTHQGKPLTVRVWYSFASHAKNDPGACWYKMELQGCSVYGE